MSKRRPRTYPMAERKNLVKLADFSRMPPAGFSLSPFLECLPRIHAGAAFGEIVGSVVRARRGKRAVLLGMGAHVIKCGLSPFLIGLIEKGVLTGVALNGAGAIHDFEIAAFGETSEDVARELPLGRFGFVEETGRWMSAAIRDGANSGRGMGEALYLAMKADPGRFPHRSVSLLWAAGERGIPCTVHVAIGTDFIHLHPDIDGAALGSTTFRDFQIFCGQVEDLGEGVYWNLGSAVILPEVFLKAVSLAHNLGISLDGMTTVDMDMLIQYRSATNVVKRPSAGIGKGYHLTGHHEIMVPLVSLAILEALAT